MRSTRSASLLLVGQILAISLSSCSPDHTTSSDPKAFSKAGTARLVPSSGVVFRLGSSDPQAAPEERPGWTRFAHDFWLDTTDVTQREFQSLMGRNPSPAISSSPSNPVVNVTWFDAILFCNARSKRDHLDTVYDYVGFSGDSTGSVWALQGLASHLDRSGWRLPTEAEWEYSARAGTSTPYFWGSIADSSKAVDYAWYQKNAGATLHPLAQLKPNPWGFYDLAGDAMEWVQDWKGSFPQDTVTDFAGPDSPGDVPEAPLKGGAYNYGLEHLRPSSRTATYAAYRSSRAEYVGFRCARGGFSATYTNSSGQSVQAPPVSILRSDVAKLLGVQSARLVFLNRSNGKGLLSWIDYGEATPVVRSLPDVDPVFHPVISPDGNWVAWCTAMEGSTGASKIKVRRLAKNDSTVVDLGSGAIPRWWTTGTDTFLVWGSSAEDNTASDWGSGQTLSQKWSAGGLTGSVQTWAPGSYHDGRSGQYLYGGYRRLRQYNLGNQTSKILFTYPQDGKAAGDTSQACNASAAPDGSGRSLFLDFGYSGQSTVVGRPYGIHEIAFEADSSGNVIQTFPVSNGKLEWDHLRWSNNAQWAAGVAVGQNGAYKEIHLLDLSTGNTFPILSGQELWMPGLWTNGEAAVLNGINPDSAGQYEAGWSGNGSMASKLRLYWLNCDSLESVFIGSSKIEHGIVPSEFSLKTMNFGYGYGMGFEAEQFLRNIIIPHSPKLKVVGLSLMAGWMFWPQADIWNTGINTSTGFTYDRNHEFWQPTIPAGFRTAVSQLRKSTPSDQLTDSLGGIIYVGTGWGASTSLDGTFPDSFFSMKTSLYQQNRAALIRTLNMLDSANVLTVIVNFPTSPVYINSLWAGYFEAPWDVYQSVLTDVSQIAASYRKVVFYDANLNGKHDFVGDDAVDPVHLSTKGGRKISHRIDSIISQALANQ